MEGELQNYLLEASRQLHELTKSLQQELAYEYAKRNNCKYPPLWGKNEKRADWVDSFLGRHIRLTIRNPQATSRSRANSFHRHNLNVICSNLEEVYSKYKFTTDALWNMDETAISAVHHPPKGIAEKSVKQVGQITSAERGIMCTLIGTVSAQGTFVPPMIIFPMVNFKGFILDGAPVGTIGAANPSGWITRDIFIKWMRHFIRHTRASKDKPLLMLLDNHDTHVYIEAISLARENGVVMATFPLHCTHRL